MLWLRNQTKRYKGIYLFATKSNQKYLVLQCLIPWIPRHTTFVHSYTNLQFLSFTICAIYTICQSMIQFSCYSNICNARNWSIQVLWHNNLKRDSLMKLTRETRFANCTQYLIKSFLAFIVLHIMMSNVFSIMRENEESRIGNIGMHR